MRNCGPMSPSLHEQAADSKTDKAMNLVEDWLQRFGEDGINAIVCQSAMTVQGVVEALRAHDLLGKIYVAAQDFTQPAGTEWLESGATYVDVFYDYNALVRGVYDTIMEHETNGTELPEQVMSNPPCGLRKMLLNLVSDFREAADG